MASVQDEPIGYRRKIPLLRQSTLSINDRLLMRVNNLNLELLESKQNIDLGSFSRSSSYTSVWLYWRRMTARELFVDPVTIAKIFLKQRKQDEQSVKIVTEFIAEIAEFMSIQEIDTPSSMKTLAAFYSNTSDFEWFNYVVVPMELKKVLKTMPVDDDIYQTILSWCKDQIGATWGFNELMFDYLAIEVGLIDGIVDEEIEELDLLGDAALTTTVWAISLLESIRDSLEINTNTEIIVSGKVDDDTFKINQYLEDVQLDMMAYSVLKCSLMHYKDFVGTVSPSDAYSVFRLDSAITDPMGDSRADVIEKKHAIRRMNAIGLLSAAGYTRDQINVVAKKERIDLENVNFDAVVRMVTKEFERNTKDDRQLAEYLLSKNTMNEITPLGFLFTSQSSIDVTETNIIDLATPEITDFYFTNMKINYRIDADSTLDLFNRTDTTVHVPFIMMKDGETSNIKAFTREGVTNHHNFSHVSSQIIKDNQIHGTKNFISFAVWLRDEFRSSRNAVLQEFDRSYTYAKMWPERGELEINVRSIYLDVVLKRIKDTFNIAIHDVKWQSSLGSFYIVGSKFINHVGFSECLRNNPVYHYYLNDSETDKVKANMSRFKMTFTQPGGPRYHSVPDNVEPTDVIDRDIDKMVQVTISSSTLPKDETVMINNTRWRVPESTGVVQLSVSKISRIGNISSFKGVFSRLWKLWTTQGNPIITKWWSTLMGPQCVMSNPLVENIKIPKRTTDRKLHNTGTTLVILQNISSRLFGGDYTTKCPRKNQPHVITDGEHRVIQESGEWRAPDGDVSTIDPVDVMTFRIPNSDTSYRMICPNAKYPYPLMKTNTDVKSVDIYGCIPCCGSSRVDLVRSEELCNGDDIEWYPSAPKNGNLLYSGQHFPSGDSVDTMLGVSGSIMFGIGYPEWYTRSREPNTMILAVLEATMNHSFIQFKMKMNREIDDAERALEVARDKVKKSFHLSLEQKAAALAEIGPTKGRSKEIAERYSEYAESFRVELTNHTNPALLKQEMPDRTDDDILEFLANSAELFDSAYLYRSLEELFGINIFVIEYNEDDKLYEFEVPKAKLNHIRHRRTLRPSIVLVRHNVDGDNSHYGYVDLSNKKHGSALFNGVETSTLFDNYSNINSVHSVIADNVNQTSTMYINYYQAVDVFARFGGPKYIRGQFIDERGHSTALVVGLLPNTPLSDKKTALILSTPPGQPENVERIHDIYNYAMSVEKKSIAAVESIIGLEAVARTVNGVWFSMEVSDDPNILFIKHDLHVICDVAGSTLPIGPPSPIQSTVDFERNNRLKMLRVVFKIVTELIEYSYAVYAKNNLNHSVPEFSRLFTVHDSKDGDSLKQYTPISLDANILLDVDVADVTTTIANAGAYVKGLVIDWPNVDGVTTKRYRFYNADFAGKMEYHLRMKFGMVLKPKIPGMITIKKAEIKTRNSTLFESIDDYSVWLRNQVSYKRWVKNFTIQDSVPIPFNPSEDVYYIVQPVNTRDEAITICLHWFYNKKNIGIKIASLMAKQCQPIVRRTKIYSIDGGNLNLINDSGEKLGEDVIAMEILESGGRWAALLPIATLVT